jgi:hypothetical protein
VRIREGGPGIVVQHLERIAAGGASGHISLLWPVIPVAKKWSVETGSALARPACRPRAQEVEGFSRKLVISPPLLAMPSTSSTGAQAPVPPAPVIMTMLNTAFYNAGPCASGSFAMRPRAFCQCRIRPPTASATREMGV